MAAGFAGPGQNAASTVGAASAVSAKAAAKRARPTPRARREASGRAAMTSSVRRHLRSAAEGYAACGVPEAAVVADQLNRDAQP